MRSVAVEQLTRQPAALKVRPSATISTHRAPTWTSASTNAAGHRAWIRLDVPAQQQQAPQIPPGIHKHTKNQHRKAHQRRPDNTPCTTTTTTKTKATKKATGMHRHQQRRRRAHLAGVLPFAPHSDERGARSTPREGRGMCCGCCCWTRQARCLPCSPLCCSAAVRGSALMPLTERGS